MWPHCLVLFTLQSANFLCAKMVVTAGTMWPRGLPLVWTLPALVFIPDQSRVIPTKADAAANIAVRMNVTSIWGNTGMNR